MSLPTLPCSFEKTRELVQIGVQQMEIYDYRPDIILAVAGGGLVPARMLRTALGTPTIPIYTVGVQSYLDEGLDKQEDNVYVYQWLEPHVIEQWRENVPEILVVDDINDTGRTLKVVTQRLYKDLGLVDANIGGFVVHDKTADHGQGKPLTSYTKDDYAPYFACEVVPKEYWLQYAWEM